MRWMSVVYNWGTIVPFAAFALFLLFFALI